MYWYNKLEWLVRWLKVREIGGKLKERREELGFTLEEMSSKTKITLAQLKALEAGDLQSFDNDLSYVRYFVRSYCQALHLDFEPFRNQLSDSIDNYTQSISLKAIKNRQEMQENIERRISSQAAPKEAKNEKENVKVKTAKKKTKIITEVRKIDYSLISLLAVIAIMLTSLVIVFTTSILPNMLNNNKPENPTSMVSPTPSATIQPTPTPTQPAKSALTMKTVDARNYEIRGWNTDSQISIKVNFAHDTWTQVLYNGVATDNPASTTYLTGTSMEMLVMGKEDFKVTIWLGYVDGNTITIDGQNFELDPKIATLKGSQKIHFTLKGE